jgi:hypothetical protein
MVFKRTTQTNDAVATTVVIDTTINNPGPVMQTRSIPASPGTVRLGAVVSAAAGVNVTAYLGAVQIYNLTTGGLVGAL